MHGHDDEYFWNPEFYEEFHGSGSESDYPSWQCGTVTVPPQELHRWGAPWRDDLESAIEVIVIEFVGRYMPPPPPRPFHRGHSGWSGETFVGWSQPPRPADVVVSFDPRAGKKDQARAVLYDYYHDDPLRYWSDNEAVKRCFGVKTKEDHDPLFLIAAYENPHHSVWNCHGDKNTWKDMDVAVQQAIAHRKKLGSLPKSSYDTNPIAIYYYDNDKMKRITYPLSAVPQALDPHNVRWWAPAIGGDSSDAGKAAGLDDVHTRETDDPKKIALERSRPGWTKGSKDSTGSAGGWSNEQFTWDKDVAGTGVIGSITGAILALVSAVLDATGVGAVIGVPLGIATPFIVAAINATDTALHAGDFGAALANLGPALAQAAVSAAGKGAGAAGIKIPPAAMQALSGTVTTISKAVASGQQKKMDFGDIWADVAKQAQSFGKLGDQEVEAIAHVIGGPPGKSGTTESSAAGHVFVQGYLAGKFLDMPALKGIAKILQGWSVFGDPRIINVALLGMGIGYVAQHQQGAGYSVHGEFDSVGQIFTHGNPHDDLAAFVHLHLAPRYGLGAGRSMVGLACPEGYDLVATDHEIACAYHKKAACLGGRASEHGTFVCTDWDYPPCPPGMTLIPGSPKNWCFPTGTGAVRGHFAGQAPPPPLPPGPPDWNFPALGCPHGYWRDPITSECRVSSPLPIRPLPPHVGAGDLETAREFMMRSADVAMHVPGAFQLGYRFEREFLE